MERAFITGGFLVLPKGGWFKLEPYFTNLDWEALCDRFKVSRRSDAVAIRLIGSIDILGDEDASV